MKVVADVWAKKNAYFYQKETFFRLKKNIRPLHPQVDEYQKETYLEETKTLYISNQPKYERNMRISHKSHY